MLKWIILCVNKLNAEFNGELENVSTSVLTIYDKNFCFEDFYIRIKN